MDRKRSSRRDDRPPQKQFPWRLHELLDDAEKRSFTSIISWLPGGHSFRIHDKDRFVEQIMPRYFNSNKHKSFQRSLNLWGFKTTRGVIHHSDFIRDRVELSARMIRVRTKNPPNKVSTMDQLLQQSSTRNLASAPTPALAPSNEVSSIAHQTQQALQEIFAHGRMLPAAAAAAQPPDNPFLSNQFQQLSSEGMHKAPRVVMAAMPQMHLGASNHQNNYQGRPAASSFMTSTSTSLRTSEFQDQDTTTEGEYQATSATFSSEGDKEEGGLDTASFQQSISGSDVSIQQHIQNLLRSGTMTGGAPDAPPMQQSTEIQQEFTPCAAMPKGTDEAPSQQQQPPQPSELQAAPSQQANNLSAAEYHLLIALLLSQQSQQEAPQSQAAQNPSDDGTNLAAELCAMLLSLPQSSASPSPSLVASDNMLSAPAQHAPTEQQELMQASQMMSLQALLQGQGLQNMDHAQQAPAAPATSAPYFPSTSSYEHASNPTNMPNPPPAAATRPDTRSNRHDTQPQHAMLHQEMLQSSHASARVESLQVAATHQQSQSEMQPNQSAGSNSDNSNSAAASAESTNAGLQQILALLMQLQR